MINVLMPVFNREKYVEQAIQSILDQTYQEFRIIIYDDGSTDKTNDIVNKIIDAHDDLDINLITSHTNRGVGYARNEIFKIINQPTIDYMEEWKKADYCVWQDSDDISHKYRLEYLVRAIENQKVDMLFSAMYFFTEPNEYYQTRTVQRIDVSKYINREGLHNNQNFATAIFKTNLTEVGIKTDLKRKEDTKWLTDLINKKITFGYEPEPLYYCRRHSERLTSKS
jgi:glycosyltransferase involved in cell wall biosynthesis